MWKGDKEMTSEDEKKDWPTCVFYHEIKCPVRKAMQGGIEKYIKSPLLKGTDEAQVVMKIADAFKGAFSNEWMVLHTFCQICPFKVRVDRAILAKSLEETMAAMKIVREQLSKEGVLT